MTTASPTPPRYVFADDGETNFHAQLLEVLPAMLDEFTCERLVLAGGALPGQRCLEVGAGAGSIAAWMADRVLGTEVVATDKDISHVTQHPGVQVVTHNIATDPLEPLGTFDTIHARLLLGHLPNRLEILAHLADILNPGGLLAIDEFVLTWDRCVMRTPDPDAHRLFAVYGDALQKVLERAGVDTMWGRQAYGAMLDLGLADVGTKAWAKEWHGGDAGCMLPYWASAQRRRELVAAGMAEKDLDSFRELLRDPRLVILGNTAISTMGRRPA